MALKDPLSLGRVRFAETCQRIVRAAKEGLVSLRFGGKAKEPPMHRRSEAGLELFKCFLQDFILIQTDSFLRIP